MKKPQLPLIIGGFAILLLVLTNPCIEEHKAAVKTKIMETAGGEMIKEAEDKGGFATLGAMLGATFAENLINNLVSRDNYLLFSLTKATFDGESKIIGVGILGNVFITTKTDELKKRAD